MKTTLKTTLAAFAIAVLAGSFAYAEDKDTPATADSHEQHHPEGQAKEATKGIGMGSGMMGSMNMDGMMGMMHECKEMHKDGKMCEQHCMDKCQEKMGKGECQKMMKEAKVKMKAEKKK